MFYLLYFLCFLITIRLIGTSTIISSVYSGVGHWPLSNYCLTKENPAIFYSKNISQFGVSSEMCPFQNFSEISIVLPIPYNIDVYESNGSNYYVIHMDVLLPLYAFIKHHLEIYNTLMIALIVVKLINRSAPPII